MKTVIITGAKGNLGSAVTNKFLGAGYRVIASIASDDSAGMGFTHTNLESAQLDLSNEEATEEFVKDAIKKYENIDAALLLVGGFAMGKLAETKSADLRKQYSLNFETAFNVARPVFSQMMKQKSGRIILVGSRPGLNMKDAKGSVAYGLSKSLVFRLAELINEEGRKNNVVASVIVPSTIDTPQNRVAMPDANPNDWVKANDIAEVMQFLCSEEANAVRDPVIRVYNNS